MWSYLEMLNTKEMVAGGILGTSRERQLDRGPEQAQGIFIEVPVLRL